MRIAIPYEDGQIFQHFGHTQRFKMYDVENGKILAAVVISAGGSGHGALAGMLKAMHVDQALAESALRFSFCPENTIEEMNTVLEAVQKNYALLSRFQRR